MLSPDPLILFRLFLGDAQQAAREHAAQSGGAAAVPRLSRRRPRRGVHPTSHDPPPWQSDAKLRGIEPSGFRKGLGRGVQDLRFMEESDLVGLPLKPIERRRFLERVTWLKVALAFISRHELWPVASGRHADVARARPSSLRRRAAHWSGCMSLCRT